MAVKTRAYIKKRPSMKRDVFLIGINLDFQDYNAMLFAQELTIDSRSS